MASGYKFLVDEGPDFVDVVSPLIRGHEQFHVVVAGPRPQGRWADAEKSHGGRLRAIGPVSEPEAIYAAADIYLEFMPMASLTSMLEAGLRGVPIVAMRGDPGLAILSSADLPGLEVPSVGLTDVDSTPTGSGRSHRESRCSAPPR